MLLPLQGVAPFRLSARDPHTAVREVDNSHRGFCAGLLHTASCCSSKDYALPIYPQGCPTDAGRLYRGATGNSKALTPTTPVPAVDILRPCTVHGGRPLGRCLSHRSRRASGSVAVPILCALLTRCPWERQFVTAPHPTGAGHRMRGAAETPGHAGESDYWHRFCSGPLIRCNTKVR
jgi:hypothetical protein